jgi:hypothetical protein
MRVKRLSKIAVFFHIILIIIIYKLTIFVIGSDKKMVWVLVDLSSWQSKITEEMSTEYEDEEIDIGETVEVSTSL